VQINRVILEGVEADFFAI